MDSTEHEDTWELEPELIKPGSAGGGLSKDMRNGHCRTAHNMSSSSLRKKSDLSLSKIQCGILRNFMSNLHEIFLETKLFVLFPAVPLAIAAQNYGFGRSVAYDRSSAPKDCRVSGWFRGPDSSTEVEKILVLKEFFYDLDKSNVQTFPITMADSTIINMVRLDFTSNHGNSAFTCIYRFRVHGYEPSSPLSMAKQP